MYHRFLLFNFCPIDFFIFKIIFPIVFVYFAKHTARVTYRNYVRRQVLCNHAARADNGIVADCYSRKNNYPRTKPAVFANMYRRIILIRFYA